MADINSYGIRNSGEYEYSELAKHESLSGAQLHDIAMFYLTKAAFDNITPEQVLDLYLFAVERIGDRIHIEGASHERENAPYGHKLEDGIPKN